MQIQACTNIGPRVYGGSYPDIWVQMFTLVVVVVAHVVVFAMTYPCERKIYYLEQMKTTSSMFNYCSIFKSGRHGRDHMAVGFTITCAIGVYHH